MEINGPKMKRTVFLLAALALLAGCQWAGESDERTSESEKTSATKAVAVTGTYAGVLPCASCSGIETLLTINPDNSYTLTELYQDENQKPFFAAGRFSWSPDKSTLTLDKNGGSRAYRVGRETLTHLDNGGRVIEGTNAAFYVLKKV